jgi:hypothetical protein
MTKNEKAIRQIQQDFIKYGEHLSGCLKRNNTGAPCCCGLDKAIENYAKIERIDMVKNWPHCDCTVENGSHEFECSSNPINQPGLKEQGEQATKERNAFFARTGYRRVETIGGEIVPDV